jgi:hypothetical protein
VVLLCMKGLTTTIVVLAGESIFDFCKCSGGEDELTFCFVNRCDAAYTCSTPCEDGVCPDGLGCWANTPCSAGRESAPPLPEDPVNSITSFCAASLDEAKETCWQPCPRGDDDCCLGLSCFDTAQSSDTSSLGQCSAPDYSGENRFYCGKFIGAIRFFMHANSATEFIIFV